jgi:hypothetical protein
MKFWKIRFSPYTNLSRDQILHLFLRCHHGLMAPLFVPLHLTQNFPKTFSQSSPAQHKNLYLLSCQPFLSANHLWLKLVSFCHYLIAFCCTVTLRDSWPFHTTALPLVRFTPVPVITNRFISYALTLGRYAVCLVFLEHMKTKRT